MTDPPEPADTYPEARPTQATPELFAETVSEYVDRGELEGGHCLLHLTDHDRRFVLGDDVGELEEADYLRSALTDLVELLDEGEGLAAPIETRIPVGDADRVSREVDEEGFVTVYIGADGLVELLETMAEQVEVGGGT